MQDVLKIFQSIVVHSLLRFAAGVVIVLIGMLISDIPTMLMSPHWPVTDGSIQKSRLVGTSVRGWDGEFFFETKAFIGYQYTVDGVEYSASRVNPIDTPFHQYQRSYTDRYPIGKEVVVYYNPRDPSDAVLEPGFVDVLKAFDIFSWILFGTGIYFVLTAILEMRKRNLRLNVF
jgi:hypothetical protein